MVYPDRGPRRGRTYYMKVSSSEGQHDSMRLTWIYYQLRHLRGHTEAVTALTMRFYIGQDGTNGDRRRRIRHPLVRWMRQVANTIVLYSRLRRVWTVPSARHVE